MSASRNPLRYDRGAAWDSVDQLLPVDANECLLEAELDDAPPGMLAASGITALTIILLIVILAEFTLLQASGFTGPAAFFPCAAFLLLFGIPRANLGPRSLLMGCLLLAASYRLAVNGSWPVVALSTWLLSGFVLSLRHESPFVLRTVMFAIESFWAGWEYLLALRLQLIKAVALPDDEGEASPLFTIGLPLLILTTGTFVLFFLRPELSTFLMGTSFQPQTLLKGLTQQISPIRLGIWLGVAWYVAGVLRPVPPMMEDLSLGFLHRDDEADVEPAEYYSPLFAVCRNVLVTVAVILAGGLVSEAIGQWRQSSLVELPFSDYLLKTAAILAFMLFVLAFLTQLGTVGGLAADPRLPRLKLLILINLGMGAAFSLLILYRVSLYLRFDGATSLRSAALLGAASVAQVFVLLGFRVVMGSSVMWALRRSAWIVGFAVYVFLVAPVERLGYEYNVQQIVGGNLRPVVHIAESEIEPAALSALLPLCEAKLEVISDGVQAILLSRYQTLSVVVAQQNSVERSWTSRQWAIEAAWQAVHEYVEACEQPTTRSERQVAIDRLQKYAQQWH